MCEVLFADKGLEKSKMLTKKLTSLSLLKMAGEDNDSVGAQAKDR